MATKSSRREYREAMVAAAAQRRRLLIPAVLAVVGIGVLVATLPGGARSPAKSSSPHLGDRALLLDILGQLKRAWNPNSQRQVLAQATDNAAAIELPLVWLLAQPDHALVPQALQVAAELKVRSALEPVLALAKVRSLRAQALRCADCIEAFSPEALEELLLDTAREVVLVGIEIAARRQPVPATMLVPALQHADAEVRRAASMALPDPVPAEIVPTVMEIARNGEPSIAVVGVQALGLAARTPEIEQFLMDLLPQAQDIVVTAVLATLSRAGQPLAGESAKRLWSLADTADSGEIVGHAFECLERTGSYSLEEVRARLPSMNPQARYHGARLLVAQGDGAGVTALLELTEELQDDREQAGLAFACRTLLGNIARMHATTTLQEFREHFAANPLPGPQRLPAAPGR